MKFPVAVAFVLAAGSAFVDATTIRGNSKSARNLMQKSRRIQQNGYYQGYYGANNGYNGNGQYGQNAYQEMDDESLWFLTKYSIKLLSCIQGEQVVNYQEAEGSTESSTVVFRLCPSDTCDTEASEFGCDAGYGDYAVGINTFVNAYLDSQKELYGDELIYYNAMGEEFNLNEYAECGEYNLEENQNQNQNGYYYGQNGYYQQGGQQQQQQQNGYQEYHYDYDYGANEDGANNENANEDANNRKLENYGQWYIGPGCTSDGKDIRFGLYRDEYCTYSPGTMMKDINYGWQNGMPYEEGGLISSSCIYCQYRDQDYNNVVNPICSDSFRSAMSRCESNMTSWNYMGPNTNGCDYITNLEYTIYGDAIYGISNETTAKEDDEEEAPHDETLEEMALRFMDKLNTRQTRAFIAAMVLFSVGACIGATMISCMCYKKRRARKRAKALVANKDVYEESKASAEMPPKPTTSMVDFIRSSSKKVSDAVSTAAIGTKVAVTTAAAGALAAVTRSLSKKQSASESSEYTNFEDDIEKMPSTDGSYKAPVADIVSIKSKKSVVSVKSASSMKSNKPVPDTISTESQKKETSAESSGTVLEWFGLNGSAKEADKKEAPAQDEKSVSKGSTNGSSKKDLSSQMDDYFSQKFT